VTSLTALLLSSSDAVFFDSLSSPKKREARCEKVGFGVTIVAAPEFVAIRCS
jgi:hypothetical protein